MTFISTIFSAIANVFGWLTNRSGLRNSPEVQAAKKAQDEQNLNAKINNAIENRDTNEIRNQISE